MEETQQDGLAVLRWIRCNPYRALTLKVDNINIAPFFVKPSEERIQKFCAIISIERIELDQHGEIALAVQCADDFLEHTTEHPPGWITPVFHPVQQGWNLIDGTIPPHGVNQKPTKMVSDNNNSSCIDVVLTCAVLLDLGRTIVDQMSPHLEYEMESLPHAIIRIVRHPWGDLSLAARNQLRELVRGEFSKLASLQPARFDGSDISAVLNMAFTGIPQVSFTTAQQQYDCRGALFLTDDDDIPTVLSAVPLTTAAAQSVGKGVNDFFDHLATTQNSFTCEPRLQCKDKHTKRLVVLDRLSPVLVVMMSGGVAVEQDAAVHCFEPFTVRYHNHSDRQQVRYIPTGAVYTADENHYFCRWLVSGDFTQLVEYDGTRGESPSVIASRDWWDTTREAKVRYIFYRRMDGDE